MEVNLQQITFGPRHHFFGYIGHCMTVPWDGSGRFIVCLETSFQDRMPTAEDAAGVMLIDTQRDFTLQRIEETRAWNPQQGTMFYWNPMRPHRQLLFNDRDRATGEVFTVLYDIVARRRVREYWFPGRSIANGGVAPAGGKFAALNYGRLARLRPVTGYPDAADWTQGVNVPDDDGVFVVDVACGECTLACSFRQMVDKLLEGGTLKPGETPAMFLNHTLWNRESDRILFYARAGRMWDPHATGPNVNAAFTVRPDGSDLVCHGYVGGHPEWDVGSRIIADGEDGLRVYDPQRRAYVDTIGNRELFSDSRGDKALSPDGAWLVHGNEVKGGQGHEYLFYRRADGWFAKSPVMSRGGYVAGSLRLDASPCWNRAGTEVLVPAIAPDGTRQLFLLRPHGK